MKDNHDWMPILMTVVGTILICKSDVFIGLGIGLIMLGHLMEDH